MGMHIVAGRDFAESDDATAPPVVIVNQALAAREWPGQNPIGKRMRPVSMDATNPPLSTVIGVVHDVPATSVTTPPAPTYYYSYRQLPYRARWLTAAVRTAGPPAALTASIATAVSRVDPLVALQFKTMTERVATSMADRRFLMVLLSAFAATALVLAAVGIFGVVSYSVSQRTREIGIRMALGATAGTVRRVMQFGALRIVAAGMLAGLMAALLLVRLIASQLYGISPTDPASLVAVVMLVIVTAVVASWIPARRGTRIDPVRAMRG